MAKINKNNRELVQSYLFTIKYDFKVRKRIFYKIEMMQNIQGKELNQKHLFQLLLMIYKNYNACKVVFG